MQNQIFGDRHAKLCNTHLQISGENFLHAKNEEHCNTQI